MTENKNEAYPLSSKRIVISFTWIAMILSSLQGDTYRLSDPIALQKILTNSGSINTSIELITIMAIIFMIPILLIIVTVLLKYSIMRWLNRIAGIFFGLFHIVYLISILFIWKSAEYEIVWAFSGLVFPLITIWLSWKLPKNEKLDIKNIT